MITIILGFIIFIETFAIYSLGQRAKEDKELIRDYIKEKFELKKEKLKLEEDINRGDNRTAEIIQKNTIEENKLKEELKKLENKLKYAVDAKDKYKKQFNLLKGLSDKRTLEIYKKNLGTLD